MTWRTYIARSLRYHRATHVGVAAGAAVAGAVLIGALAVGDSVRHTLARLADARLGRIEHALFTPGRFVAPELAGNIGRRLNAPVAAVLRLRASVAAGGGAARVNGVELLGVDARFWELGGRPAPSELQDHTVLLNTHLAARLGVKEGGQVLLRMEKPGLLSRDALLAVDEDTAAARRVTVAGIVSDDGFGRFSLEANQVAPMNAFVPRGWLGRAAELGDRVNMVLAGVPAAPAAPPSAERMREALAHVWRLEDVGLKVAMTENGAHIELKSDRVFLDDPVVAAAAAAGSAPVGYLTYLVNAIRRGEAATPYSMVSAYGPLAGGGSDSGLSGGGIVINRWLADDLQAVEGDALDLAYYVSGPMRLLEERTTRMHVTGIVPVVRDPGLMPEFPGLSDADTCSRWDVGIPIDLERIRDKDEAYWDAYRGTPKAFVSLDTGRAMWRDRFGDLTSVRWPASDGTAAEIRDALRRRIDPAALGLFFSPVREVARSASMQSLDFGQLFLGLSFFLLAAALLLVGLLFVFGVERRTEEIGTLRALGASRGRVRLLLLAEGGVLALGGSVLGVAGGLVYAWGVLWALASLWQGAVGTTTLFFHAAPGTLAVGAVANTLCALGAVWATLHTQLRREARELLAGGPVILPAPAGAPRRIGRTWTFWAAAGAAGAAAALVAAAGTGQGRAQAGVFFGAGTLLLCAGLCASHVVLDALARSWGGEAVTRAAVGLRNAARRRGRSLAVVALLACGTFLVIAVGANRRDPRRDAHSRGAGTGGFALFGDTTMPVYRDLNAARGVEAYGIDAADLDGVRFVAMRVRDGDDASCLNLNRVQTPRLVGVHPEAFAVRGAFTFTAAAAEASWRLLDGDFGRGVVPAVADAATITWALGKTVGDTLAYVDERGNAFQVKIVGAVASSLLQGPLIISERHFTERFPSESGYRMFLVDVDGGEERVQAVAMLLMRQLSDVGLALVPAWEKLAVYDVVENTYLSIFQALGGLGLILGSVALGIVVLRNVLERRGELGLLRAVGYSRRSLVMLVLCEHWVLVLLGIGCGAGAAVLAVLPALRAPGADVPVAALGVLVAGVMLNAALWTWAAARYALRGGLIEALRNE